MLNSALLYNLSENAPSGLPVKFFFEYVGKHFSMACISSKDPGNICLNTWSHELWNTRACKKKNKTVTQSFNKIIVQIICPNQHRDSNFPQLTSQSLSLNPKENQWNQVDRSKHTSVYLRDRSKMIYLSRSFLMIILSENISVSDSVCPNFVKFHRHWRGKTGSTKFQGLDKPVCSCALKSLQTSMHPILDHFKCS